MGPMLDQALRNQGKTVAHIGVPNGQDPPQTGFNVLGWIDIDHPEAEIHVRTVVSWIYEEDRAPGRGEDPFFAPMGRELVTCLLAHLLWSAIAPEDRTLATLAAGISIPEDAMLTTLAGIRQTSNSPMARRIAGVLMKCKAEETFSGVYMNAAKGIAWLFTAAYADLVSVGSFTPRALMTERCTVFLNVSLRTLETTPAIARVLVGALLNTVYMDDGKSGRRILFLLDEAARLGRLKALETARDTGRKYGVVLHMLWQSVGQMAETWGREGARAWTDAMSWIGYAAIRAGGAGKDVSEQIGTHGVVAYSEGDNQGQQKPWGLAFGSRSKGTTTNAHEIKRALATAPELQQDLREDEIIIVPSNGLPIRCGRAIFFRRRDMVAKVASNRFAGGKAA
jgi:type IV secretion system protein VirD4